MSAPTLPQDANGSFTIEIGGQKITAQAPNTGSWDKFQKIEVGRLEIKQPGNLEVNVRAIDPANWKPVNLNLIQMTRLE